MSYFPVDMPAPEPNMDDQGFWRCCADRRLSFQSCSDCHTARHPPTPVCAKCHSTQVEWVQAPEIATVYTYTVIRHAGHTAVTTKLPYVVAVVEFDELAGVRFVTNITHLEPAEVSIGMKVRVWWDLLEEQSLNGAPVYIPRFKPERLAG